MSIRGNGRSGNGEPSPWLKRTIDELKANTAELREEHRLSKIRIARAEDQIDIMKRDLAESRRLTREVIAEFARMDAQRKQDSAALVDALKGMNVRVTRLERRS